MRRGLCRQKHLLNAAQLNQVLTDMIEDIAAEQDRDTEPDEKD